MDLLAEPIRAELRRGPSPMAIRASDHALRHLSPDGRRGASGEHRADRRALRPRIDVIEVEDDGIRFAAVNACAGLQELLNEIAIPLPALRSSSVILRHVVRLVACVVLLSVLAAAGPAVGAEGPARGVLHRELAERLRDLATRAGAEEGRVRHRDTRVLGCGPLRPRLKGTLEQLF